MSRTDEKRQAPRIQPFVASCRYVVGEARLPGFLTDLSTRGGRIHTDLEPPPDGTQVAVEVRLGRQPTHVRVPASVEWGKTAPRGGFVFGVSFDTSDPEVRNELERVVAEFHRRAASIE